MTTELCKVGDARIDLLIDLGGVDVDPALAELFIAMTTDVAEPRARALLFFGSDARFGIDVHPTRSAALRHLETIRDERSSGSSRTGPFHVTGARLKLPTARATKKASSE